MIIILNFDILIFKVTLKALVGFPVSPTSEGESPFCSSAKKSNQSTDQTRAPDWLVFGTEGVSSFYDMMMMMVMMLMMISIGALWEL